MSARQLNRLRAKGGKRLDPLLGGALNEGDEEQSEEESHEESANDRAGPGLAAVRAHPLSKTLFHVLVRAGVVDQIGDRSVQVHTRA